MEIKIRELIDLLNKASEAYYNSGEIILSDKEFDDYMEQLNTLEQDSGIIFPDSPTQNVGIAPEESKGKKKVRHEFPAKSLDKTKDRESLKEWLNGKAGCLSWKLDGQTVQATYNKGVLVQAASRGNGEIGIDVTQYAKYITGLPLTISYKGKLVVRGESVMSYEEFERINAQLPEGTEKYKNPRNLAVGTLNSDKEEDHFTRKLNFIAFQMVYMDDGSLYPLFSEKLDVLEGLKFNTVPYEIVTPDTILDSIADFEHMVTNGEFNFPTDGLVLAYEEVEYGLKLGMTGKFPRHSKAFKWKDECVESRLLSVEWSPSRTGLINPVAVFEPVEIEGTTVARASIFNVSTFEALKMGKGDRVMVYKANMIIPQIAENLDKTDTLTVPAVCPVCGSKTEIKTTLNKDTEVKTLYCSNPDCSCKLLGKLEHFAEKNAMNMDGISEKTIEQFYEQGWLKSFSDFYSLKEHTDEMKTLDKMGETAVSNILQSVENSRKVELKNFIYALGIPFVGRDTAKLIAENVKTVDGMLQAFESAESLSQIDGIGPVVVEAIGKWYASEVHVAELMNLIKILDIEETVVTGEQKLSGLTFVITGSVNQFANRDALKDFIEANGGKVAGSVSKNTSYLINNDVTSSSGKNKKAKELNVPIINEDSFMELLA